MNSVPFLQAGFNGRHYDTGICGATRHIDGKRFAPARLICFEKGDYAWRGDHFLAWGEQVVIGTWEGLAVRGTFDCSELDARPRQGQKVAFTILGEPASKANSRELVLMNRHSPKKGRMVKMPALIKSEKAREYESTALQQIPPLARLRMEGPMRMTVRIFYASGRPDNDASLIKDVLQDRYAYHGEGEKRQRVLIQRGVYRNDRQVKEEHYYHDIDRANPRAEIEVEPIAAPIFREVAA